MATYAIGDIHGCYLTLLRLLARIGFDRGQDRLWLVGDLVNRGPRSLAVLRWAAELDDRIVTVLGNHDLHLLARAAGVAKPRRRDTLDEVLAAPDRDDLLHWLGRRPLLHREDGRVLVHAGLFPSWTVEMAAELAAEVSGRLRPGSPSARRLLHAAGKNAPERWSEQRTSRAARARAALAGFARLRAIDASGRMCADFSGPPAEAPPGCLPWFSVAGRRSAQATVIFGHWAAMGLHLAPGLAGLDTGCAWGGSLTAIQVEDGRVFSEPAAEV